MTVKELIAELEECANQDAIVRVWDSYQETYVPIEKVRRCFYNDSVYNII